MRQMISVWFVLALCAVISAQQTSSQDKVKAERLWDLAIAAKGGRARLCSISNIHISSTVRGYSGTASTGRNEFLIVYPDRYWQWKDMRPSVFGLEMTMYNLQSGKRYFASQGQTEVPLRPIESSDPVERRFSALIWLTLETAWRQPKPEQVVSYTIYGKQLDIVRTRLQGERVDFALDQKTHLPLVVRFFSSRANGRQETLNSEVQLSDYEEADGILVPRTVNGEKYRYEFNVDYDPGIFLSAPLPVESAGDAWRKN